MKIQDIWILKNGQILKNIVSIYKQKEFFRRIDKNIKQSKNKLIQEYKNQSEIPVWLIVDVLTFGEILNLYKLMKKEYKEEIA